jgi:hypothetical protein
MASLTLYERARRKRLRRKRSGEPRALYRGRYNCIRESAIIGMQQDFVLEKVAFPDLFSDLVQGLFVVRVKFLPVHD